MARISGKQDSERALERIGIAIRERRVAVGLSQEALADAASVDRSHMGKIERGERNVTVLILVRVARALGSSVAEVMKAAHL